MQEINFKIRVTLPLELLTPKNKYEVHINYYHFIAWKFTVMAIITKSSRLYVILRFIEVQQTRRAKPLPQLNSARNLWKNRSTVSSSPAGEEWRDFSPDSGTLT